MELNLSCMPWALHRWKSLNWAGCIPVFHNGLTHCLLWSWSLGGWVVNIFKGLICLKVCLWFCFVGYFLDTPSLWNGMLDKCQCWHWEEAGRTVTLEKQTWGLLWNWTSLFRELSGAEKIYFTRERKDDGSGWCVCITIVLILNNYEDPFFFWLHSKLEVCMLLFSKSIVSFCLLLPASPCSAVSNFKFLGKDQVKCGNSCMEPSWY